MKMIKNVTVALLTAAFLVASAQAQEKLERKGRYYVGEITKSFKVSKGGLLRMEDIRGDVRISSWDKEEVWVHEIKSMDVFTEQEARIGLERSKANYRVSENEVIIGGPDAYRPWMSSRFTVKVPREFNISVQTSGGDVSVEAVKGACKIKTSGGDIELSQIEGSLQAKTAGGDIKIREIRGRAEVETSGGDITASGIQSFFRGETAGGDIRLEDCFDSVYVSTSGGDIEIFGTKKGVYARTAGGDIKIVNTRGAVEARTSGGDVNIRRVGGNVEAKTAGGDIEVEEVEGGTAVKTSGGGIEVTQAKGWVEAHTAGGDIRVEMTPTDYQRDHHADLKTAGGDVTLIIPPDLPATLDLEIKLQNVGWERYTISSDFPLSIEQEDRGWTRIIRARGDINGGGDRIRIRTTNGNITVRKGR